MGHYFSVASLRNVPCGSEQAHPLRINRLLPPPNAIVRTAVIAMSVAGAPQATRRVLGSLLLVPYHTGPVAAGETLSLLGGIGSPGSSIFERSECESRSSRRPSKYSVMNLPSLKPAHTRQLGYAIFLGLPRRPLSLHFGFNAFQLGPSFGFPRRRPGVSPPRPEVVSALPPDGVLLLPGAF